MKIISFHAHHDASYSVLENGLPTLHNELERFTRRKFQISDPIKHFLSEENEILDINHLAICRDCGLKRYNFLDSLKQIESLLQRNGGKTFLTGHHQSHAANAFFSSQFKRALIVTIDGGGVDFPDGSLSGKESLDNTNDGAIFTAFTIWQGIGNKIIPIKMIPRNIFNPGFYWLRVTRDIFGLGTIPDPRGDQTGTVMGMSALGDPDKYAHHFKNFGDFKVINNWQDIFPIDGSKLVEDAKFSEQNRFDIAAALQKETETVLSSLITPYIHKEKSNNLCLSGGVSLNCVFTGKLFDLFPGINIFCDPIPYDGGLTLGASRYVYHNILNKPRIYSNPSNYSPYLGAKYDFASIREKLSIEADKITFKIANDDEVINLMLQDSNIISLFGGGSESGRRALGNRSIVADPRDPNIKEIINEKVKHRQWFRPFAPSILREDVAEWFSHDIDSPFMSFCLKFRDEMSEKVPAVSHLDKTARLQTVTPELNYWYYQFIRKFKQKTGIPMILNTSFNDCEPIVESPNDAVNCFLKTNIDYLYFRDFNILVMRK